MKFCIVQDTNQPCMYLTMLLNIDYIYKDYEILIACSENIKKYIEEFPFVYSGNIHWLILENYDYNYIKYKKNWLLALNEGIKLFNEIIFIDYNIYLINKLNISNDIKEQGIGFVSRSVDYDDDNINQKYISNIFYINNKKYLDEIENYFIENFEEWNEDENKNKVLTPEEKQVYNKKISSIDVNKLYSLVKKMNINYFLHHSNLLSTEDFFAFNNRVELKNINNEWKISDKFLHEEDKKEIKNEEDDNEEDKKEIKDEEEINFINICAINIRRTQTHEQVLSLNKKLLVKLVNYNPLYIFFINIKNSQNKIELIVPNKDGIGIWDRNNDKPGLYELLEIITKDSPYFQIKQINTDYFIFNNYILTDKASYYYLNSNIKNSSGVILCNYDSRLETELHKSNIKVVFGFYYSDYPKLLDNLSKNPISKKRFCLEILDNKVIEYELSKKKTNLNHKKVIKFNSPSEMLELISESEYLILDNFNVNLIANCIGLKTIPVLKNNALENFKNLKLHLLEVNKNFIIEPQKWENIDSENIILNNDLFYKEEIAPHNIAKKLLKIIFTL